MSSIATEAISDGSPTLLTGKLWAAPANMASRATSGVPRNAPVLRVKPGEITLTLTVDANLDEEVRIVPEDNVDFDFNEWLKGDLGGKLIGLFRRHNVVI